MQAVAAALACHSHRRQLFGSTASPPSKACQSRSSIRGPRRLASRAPVVHLQTTAGIEAPFSSLRHTARTHQPALQKRAAASESA
eukprot:3208761-Prymnesium_polylepis.1